VGIGDGDDDDDDDNGDDDDDNGDGGRIWGVENREWSHIVNEIIGQ